MPFLTIYTPTYRRPKALAQCLQSVQIQICQDLEHIVHNDGTGMGIAGMFARLVYDSDQFQGEYVYVLQDDDWLADELVVADLKEYIRSQDNPPVVICRNRKSVDDLPFDWQSEPVYGHIDLGSYVVRRDVFYDHQERFLTERYAADFDFIRSIWNAGQPFSWYDRLIAESDQYGRGMPE